MVHHSPGADHAAAQRDPCRTDDTGGADGQPGLQNGALCGLIQHSFSGWWRGRDAAQRGDGGIVAALAGWRGWRGHAAFLAVADDRSGALELNSPKNRLLRQVSELEKSTDKLKLLMGASLDRAQMNLARGAASLNALSPLAVLARGYGYVQNEEGKSLSSVSELHEGDNIRITMKDGTAWASVSSVEKG